MSERHFFSATTGHYWVAIDDPTDAVRAGYPADTVELPPPPSPEHRWQGGAWVHVPPAPPDLSAERWRMRLSRRQLLIGLAAGSWITEAEAIAAATTGAMPAAIEAAIAGLPVADQVAARITWAAMTEARRLDPLVELLAAAQGVDDDVVDQLFVTFATV